MSDDSWEATFGRRAVVGGLVHVARDVAETQMRGRAVIQLMLLCTTHVRVGLECQTLHSRPLTCLPCLALLWHVERMTHGNP